LIIKNATAREIWELARKQGSVAMFEDAKNKAQLGVTTYNEVFRVTPPQD